MEIRQVDGNGRDETAVLVNNGFVGRADVRDTDVRPPAWSNRTPATGPRKSAPQGDVR